MNRNEFLKTCGYACLGGMAFASMLQSCKTTKSLTLPINENAMLLEKKEFEINKKGKISYRRSVILYNDNLQFPVAVFRFDETKYSALFMQCSHQGAELQVFGEKLLCPAHGSEFNSMGVVSNGPAIDRLRTFQIEQQNEALKILLR